MASKDVKRKDVMAGKVFSTPQPAMTESSQNVGSIAVEWKKVELPRPEFINPNILQIGETIQIENVEGIFNIRTKYGIRPALRGIVNGKYTLVFLNTDLQRKLEYAMKNGDLTNNSKVKITKVGKTGRMYIFDVFIA